MSDYRFRLQPYKGISTRYTCPECKQKRCFSRYIDTEGKIQFPSYVGRCDHEQRCGYHYTPSDYFKDNPSVQEKLSEERMSIFIPRVVERPKPISYIPSEIVEASTLPLSMPQIWQGADDGTDEEILCRYIKALARCYCFLAD